MPVTPLDEDCSTLFALPDETATAALAERFAHALVRWHVAALSPGAGCAEAAGSVGVLVTPRAPLQVHLNGNLGAGKTAFVRATLRALGYAGRVRSPTYTLVEPYRITVQADVAPLTVHHFDLYRFSDPAEWVEAGFDDYLSVHAVNMIEWPERGAGVLPPPDLSFTLDILDPGRTLHARAFSAAGRKCLHDID